MSGILYAICAGDAVKIGVTGNSVESRLAELQTGNAHILQIAAQYMPRVMDAYELERRVHSYMPATRVSGEWFCLCEKCSIHVSRVIMLMNRGCLEEFLDPGIEMPKETYPADVEDPLAPIAVRVRVL